MWMDIIHAGESTGPNICGTTTNNQKPILIKPMTNNQKAITNNQQLSTNNQLLLSNKQGYPLRTINWFQYLWDNNQSGDEQEILSVLPVKVQQYLS